MDRRVRDCDRCIALVLDISDPMYCGCLVDGKCEEAAKILEPGAVGFVDDKEEE